MERDRQQDGREDKTNLYVGNLAFGATDEDLQALFETYGEVAHVKVITDQESGRSKGFGFVRMATEDQAAKALVELNESDFMGRRLLVNIARPRPPRDGGGNNRNPNHRPKVQTKQAQT